MISLLLLVTLATLASSAQPPVREAYCRPNQIVNKITVFEDGGIEAECGPIPCGNSGIQCVDDNATCKSEADSVFSGMKWGKNGQSLALRCCNINVANKIYVGTDLVGLGSYYTGGLVGKTEMFGHGGPEYDYVSNIRAEQGGVRIWVYRIMCPVADTKPQARQPVVLQEPQAVLTPAQRRQNVLQQLSQQQQQTQVSESNDEQGDEAPSNPLQYKPAARMARQKDSPMHASRRVL